MVNKPCLYFIVSTCNCCWGALFSNSSVSSPSSKAMTDMAVGPAEWVKTCTVAQSGRRDVGIMQQRTSITRSFRWTRQNVPLLGHPGKMSQHSLELGYCGSIINHYISTQVSLFENCRFIYYLKLKYCNKYAMCHNGIIHESNVRFGVLLCMVTRFYGKKNAWI